MRRLEGAQRPLALLVGAEDADEYPGVAEIGRRVDSCDRHEADAGVLQLRHGFGEHLQYRLVHASHPLRHGQY